jgi:hypothetical protein
MQVLKLAQFPQVLLLLCSLVLLLSCNLLLPIKEYGEVHVEIRGSSHLCTGKFTSPYGEVHIYVRGSSLLRYPIRAKRRKSVRGSSRKARNYGMCTGKFT